MAAAHAVAQLLAGIGVLYLPGLGMSDNPVLAGLRTQLDQSGFVLIVARTVPIMINPCGVPHVLAIYLGPNSSRSPPG